MASTLNASTTLGLISSADTSGVLQLQTANTAALTIDASQNVGIGTASPVVKLDITGNDRLIRLNATSNNALIRYSLNGTSKFSQGLNDPTGWILYDDVASAYRLIVDYSGNLGLRGTPSAWTGINAAMDLGASVAIANTYGGGATIAYNCWQNGSTSTWYYKNSALATIYEQVGGAHYWKNGASGTAGNAISFTQAMTLDASGNLLVGTTSGLYSARITASTSASCASLITTTSAEYSLVALNQGTSGNNGFVIFQTENSPVTRGSITYNRGAGLVAYNVTSDYRAKDISGPVTDSGALIDSVPVYMGTMKGATQERPMFIAHETPAYAHTGEKDAVDADGNPVYQQMDASALIPVMWAEIQSLRQRLAVLEGK